jgi:hypothetical protein
VEWYQLKVAISTSLGVSQDALHVLAGVMLQILVAFVIRRPLSHLAPWLVVVALTGLNEFSDLRMEIWPNRSDQWTETIKDLVTTLTLPTLILLLARFRPGLFGPRAAARNP